MADTALKDQIRGVLKQGYFDGPDDAVYVSDSEDSPDDVHVVVVSPKLRGKRPREKNDLIWSVLTGRLQPGEWGHITLSVGHSPEELKTF